MLLYESMITRRKHKEFIWIDLEAPTGEEVRAISEEFSIHPLVTEAILEPSIRPKVERYEDTLYVEMQFPTITNTKRGSKQQEIDFVIGKNFLITSHYEAIDTIHNFGKVFEVNSILEKGIVGDEGTSVFFHLVKALYRDMGMELGSLRSHVKTIEDKIFKGNQKELVEVLSEIAHKILDFREATRFHKGILASFEELNKKVYGDEFSYYGSILTSEYLKVWETLENLRETVIELKKTNDSLLAYKTNRTIDLLTVLTFITLPLELIPDFFTTSVFVHGHYSSTAIHLASFIGCVLLFFLLKFKRII